MEKKLFATNKNYLQLIKLFTLIVRGKMNNYQSLRILQIILLFLLATLSVICAEEVHASPSSEVLEIVNEERAVYSIQPLKLDNDLEKAADIRVLEVITFFSHTRPDGSSFSTVNSKVNSENLAGGYKTPREVVDAWMASPGHKKNILNSDYTIMGLSYKKTDTGYKYYWVQLFGGKKVTKISIAKVSGLKAETKKNQIILKWKKQPASKVSGYEISVYNPSTKKYQFLKKIDKSSINGLKISGLKSSTTYTYQIKSFKVVNKKTYYASGSAITVKTKK